MIRAPSENPDSQPAPTRKQNEGKVTESELIPH